MTSYEVVKRAIHFENPPRIPYNFDSNRTPVDGIEYGEDMLWVFATMRPMQEGKNEWGVEYHTIDESFGEPKVYPLQGKDSLEGYVFPDFGEEWRYDAMKGQIEENAGEKYVLGMLPCGLLQHMIDLFGFEDFLMNVLAEPELVKEVGEQFLKIAKTTAKKMAEMGAHGIITMDDAALQDRPMMSIESFKELFLPHFEELYSYCHSLGLDVFLHSCGYTLDLLELLIDAGCDVINLDQQYNMGMEELTKRYRGKVCFYCPLDIQRTLEFSEADIRAEVHKITNALGTRDGGFIAKTYPQPRAIGIKDSYMAIMADEFKKLDVETIDK